MRRIADMRTVAATCLLVAGATIAQAAADQSSGSGQSKSGVATASPDVTVRAPERMICRSVQRTATRMRSSRVCRTVTEWEEARAGRSQDEVLAEAADTLEILGEKISTNCTGGMSGGHDGPLGPR